MSMDPQSPSDVEDLSDLASELCYVVAELAIADGCDPQEILDCGVSWRFSQDGSITVTCCEYEGNFTADELAQALDDEESEEPASDPEPA